MPLVPTVEGLPPIIAPPGVGVFVGGGVWVIVGVEVVVDVPGGVLVVVTVIEDVLVEVVV